MSMLTVGLLLFSLLRATYAAQNVTVLATDGSSGIQYNGRWHNEPSGAQTGSTEGECGSGLCNVAYNDGATFTFTFNGTAIYLYTIINPPFGSVNFSLDGVVTNFPGVDNSSAPSCAALFRKVDLPLERHVISGVLLNGATGRPSGRPPGLSLYSIVYTVPDDTNASTAGVSPAPPPSTSPNSSVEPSGQPNLGAIIGGVVVGVIIILLIGLLLCRRLRRQGTRRRVTALGGGVGGHASIVTPDPHNRISLEELGAVPGPRGPTTLASKSTQSIPTGRSAKPIAKGLGVPPALPVVTEKDPLFLPQSRPSSPSVAPQSPGVTSLAMSERNGMTEEELLIVARHVAGIMQSQPSVASSSADIGSTRGSISPIGPPPGYSERLM